MAYAPAAYFRPLRACYGQLAVEEQRSLNIWVTASQRLPAPCNAALGRMGRQMVLCWQQLPEVAMLVAAACLRRRLLAEPAALALPGPLHHFLRLHPEADRSAGVPGLSPANGVADPLFLQQWGALALQGMALGLPHWLGARLPLPFAGGPAVPPTCVIEPHPDLLWSALRHVEAFS